MLKKILVIAMSETIDEEKIDKAIGLLKDAGFDDIVIVGKAFGQCVKTSDFHENASFNDVAEVQGYLAQTQVELTAMEITSEETSGENSKKTGDTE